MKIPATTEAATPTSMATGTAESENYGLKQQDITRPGEERENERERERKRENNKGVELTMKFGVLKIVYKL